jgi:hypothetical protein
MFHSSDTKMQLFSSYVPHFTYTPDTTAPRTLLFCLVIFQTSPVIVGNNSVVTWWHHQWLGEWRHRPEKEECCHRPTSHRHHRLDREFESSFVAPVRLRRKILSCSTSTTRSPCRRWQRQPEYMIDKRCKRHNNKSERTVFPPNTTMTAKIPDAKNTSGNTTYIASGLPTRTGNRAFESLLDLVLQKRSTYTNSIFRRRRRRRRRDGPEASNE